MQTQSVIEATILRSNNTAFLLVVWAEVSQFEISIGLILINWLHSILDHTELDLKSTVIISRTAVHPPREIICYNNENKALSFAVLLCIHIT